MTSSCVAEGITFWCTKCQVREALPHSHGGPQLPLSLKMSMNLKRMSWKPPLLLESSACSEQ